MSLNVQDHIIKRTNLALAHRFRRDRAVQVAFESAISPLGYKMPSTLFTADLVHYRHHLKGEHEADTVILIAGQVAVEAIETLRGRLREITLEVKRGVSDSAARKRLFFEANEIQKSIAEMTDKLEELAL